MAASKTTKPQGSKTGKAIDSLKDLVEHIKQIHDKCEGTVEKTIPIKPEWRKQIVELKNVESELEQLAAKRRTLKNAFWSRVEIDINTYDRSLRYNLDTDEIEVLSKDKE
jgi:hypothetical protein